MRDIFNSFMDSLMNISSGVRDKLQVRVRFFCTPTDYHQHREHTQRTRSPDQSSQGTMDLWLVEQWHQRRLDRICLSFLVLFFLLHICQCRQNRWVQESRWNRNLQFSTRWDGNKQTDKQIWSLHQSIHQKSHSLNFLIVFHLTVQISMCVWVCVFVCTKECVSDRIRKQVSFWGGFIPYQNMQNIEHWTRILNS